MEGKDTDNQLVYIPKTEKKPLTKAQETFNRLNKRVAKLKELMEKDKLRLESILTVFRREITPLDQRTAEVRMSMAMKLSELADRWKLSPRQFEDMQIAIVCLFDQAFQVIEPDQAQQDVYNRWSGSNYAEEIEEEKTEMADFMSKQFKDMFGVEVDFRQFEDDPEAFARFQAEMQDKFGEEGHFGQSDPFQASRKKTKKALEREAREKKAAEQQRKSLRGIYMSLVKLLHPDRAKDDKERLEKEEAIKMVTKAYEEKDLPSLLRMEMQWLADATENLEKLSDEKLGWYNASLREQVRELEAARFLLKRDPRYEPISRYIDMNEKAALRQIYEETLSKREMLAAMESDLDRFDKKPLKQEVVGLATVISSLMQQQLYDPFDDVWDSDEDELW